MHVETIDPRDDAAFDGWYRAYSASWSERWPHEQGWLPEELRTHALDEGLAHGRDMLLGARRGGTIVGAAEVVLPHYDNRHLAEVTIEVDPAFRRQGVGTSLVAAAEALTVGEGRTVVRSFLQLPVRDEARQAAVVAFADKLGYDVAQAAVRRDLHLPPEPGRLEALEAAAWPFAAGYGLVSWAGRLPDRYVADRIELMRRMSTDAPLGELALEEEHWDEGRLRASEAFVAAQGRTLLSTGAVDQATGRLVAVTALAVPGAAPERAWQWDTIVLPEHRGHRLGTLVKVANLRQLAERSPVTRVVSTTNAAENTYMIAVNESLGCVVAAAEPNFQKALGPTVV